MGNLRHSLRRIPYWAYLLVLAVIGINTAWLIYRGRIPLGGATLKMEQGYYIHDFVNPRGSVYEAGIRPGDTLVSMDAVAIEKWQYNLKTGDTVIAGILRNGKETAMPVIIDSIHSYAPWFFWSVYIIVILVTIGSLWLLYKKPNDKSAVLFFIVIQMFMIVINAISYQDNAPLGMIAVFAFHFSSCFIGTALIHFHLLFPKPATFFNQGKRWLILFYILSFILLTAYFTSYYFLHYPGFMTGKYYGLFDRIVVSWMTLTFLLALVVAVFQFRTIKDTLSRNQLRLVITGSAFGFIGPAAFSLFYKSVGDISAKYPLMVPVSQGTATMILICCILVAIFRYRIWDIEIFIRRAMLYLGATMVIMLSYLLLLYLVDLFTLRESSLTRFVMLALSVIIFLAVRDWLQRMLERVFFREKYDPTTVVSRFEEKLAGIYRADELKSGIVMRMDEIFHFSHIAFLLKKNELVYETVFSAGLDHQRVKGEFMVTRELENRLQKQKVFTPGEMEQMPVFIEETHAELVVPVLKDEHPFGFFLCGPKKSEKPYSMQDIRLLSLIARRVNALFHTAALYQKDLDRQLMLERERARISQDMHDDIGASLTRISMMSDLVNNRTDVGDGARQWLAKISNASRGLMEEMNQIIWALNPRNDNLEGLVTYIRRFAFEYLEPTTVDCVFDLPAEMPHLALSVEVRRNVYLVSREAVHNVVKHSGATKVVITFTPQTPLCEGERWGEERSFKISIHDNGKGFDPGKFEFQGNGLINMKKRMHEIGGALVIHSIIGRGTEIELEVPVR